MTRTLTFTCITYSDSCLKPLMPLLVVVAGNTVLYSIPNQRMAATLRNACRPDVLTLSFGASTLERGPTTPVAFQQPQREAASRVVRVVKKLQKNRLHAVFYIDEESDLYSDTKLGKRLEELGVTTSQPNWYSTLPPGVDTNEGGEVLESTTSSSTSPPGARQLAATCDSLVSTHQRHIRRN